MLKLSSDVNGVKCFQEKEELYACLVHIYRAFCTFDLTSLVESIKAKNKNKKFECDSELFFGLKCDNELGQHFLLLVMTAI